MNLSAVRLRNFHWYNLLWYLLQLSPIALTSNITAGSAIAQSFDSLPTPLPDSPIYQETPTLSLPTQQSTQQSATPLATAQLDAINENMLVEWSGVEDSQGFSPNTGQANSLRVQTIETAQVVNPNIPTVPDSPRDETQPPPSPTPIPNPTPLDVPSPLPEGVPQTPRCRDTDPSGEPGSIPDTITVRKFEFIVDNPVFPERELENLVKDYLDKPLSLAQLVSAASEIAKHYAEQDYSTTGAIVCIPKQTQQQGEGVVKIQIIEGELKEEDIQIEVKSSRSRLNPNYVRSRLALVASKPLNTDDLQEALQLLQLDPLIETVTARLSAGPESGQSILKVQVEEADSFSSPLSISNGRSPSVGTFQRQVALTEANLLGIGDRLRVGYTNTDGSNGWDASYTLPLNPRDGTLSFAYSRSANDVIEPPFDDIDGDGSSPDIESASRSYELTLRQPIIREIRRGNSEGARRSTFQELALGLTASLRESETSLLDIPFPLSPGANDEGFTRVFALRFFQEWTQQNEREVIALRSQFNFGLDAFNATINEPIAETNEAVPDSRFFSWQGQAQWLRVLARDTQLLVRANAQLADKALLSSEQFAVGGLGSVRGYRQDTLQTDNDIFASAEVQLPVLRVFRDRGVIQVVPFVDFGTAWNSSGNDNPDPNTLASVGLGLQWRQGDNFTARLDWGIPLISVDSRDRTWQENGFHFSLQYNP
ncbi:MAG: ShlB/FhaC/HecB family hemolysin secretion/activation protein [Coleofasciculus sp. S288]|nr:ShlB/FhaC/HecB family hemolysin secretion/activation protein [Coleofasciculus sp. S288]